MPAQQLPSPARSGVNQLTLTVEPIAGNVEVLASPLGATPALGDDFSSVYPAGQPALGAASGRLRVHSILRTFRIATGNGGGSYRVEWAPIQLGYSFLW